LSHRETLFIDCGANIGWWSLLAEKRFDWHCIAVEAAPDVARKLERTGNPAALFFEIVNKAIWNREREGLQFLTRTDIHAGGHLKTWSDFCAGALQKRKR
jgi:FkbM family methyltransferase